MSAPDREDGSFSAVCGRMSKRVMECAPQLFLIAIGVAFVSTAFDLTNWQSASLAFLIGVSNLWGRP